MMHIRQLKPLVPYGIYLSVLAFAGFLKVSYLIGSKNAFLTGTEIFSPLAGWLGGSWFIMVLFVGKYLVSGAGFFSCILHKLPGLCGAMCWSTQSRLIRVGIPLVCMALFCMHPVGKLAWMYSLYWLIPIIIYSKKSHVVFVSSLGSTFVTHAVGSIIWLYTVPMTAEQWLFLLPVVALERLVIAGSMSFVIWSVTFLRQSSVWLRILQTLGYSRPHTVQS